MHAIRAGPETRSPDQKKRFENSKIKVLQKVMVDAIVMLGHATWSVRFPTQKQQAEKEAISEK